jgi:hypothetical protein
LPSPNILTKMKMKMKFITAAPVLFTSTVFAAWTTTPALSAKVKASTTINDKDADIYAVDNKSSRSLESIDCMDTPLDWYDNRGLGEFDCVWYSEGRRCEAFGDKNANRGRTANEACCTCGGGYSGYSPVAFANKDELKEAIDEYCNDPVAWKYKEKFNIYGPIESWDVSKILDMSFLFRYKGDCNPDIGNWNVGKVTSFYGMFSAANSFNQDIGAWDVSSGTDFSFMFFEAGSFNQDISGWDVSSGVTFRGMFSSARSFNQDIGKWDVSSGTDFYGMFADASAFDQDLCNWQMKSDAMKDYFCLNAVSCGDCTISVM